MPKSSVASRLCLAAALSAVLAVSGTMAIAGERVYLSSTIEPRLPACDSAAVQSAVTGHIASADAFYYGGRTITSISRISEVAYKVNGISPLARRYCSGLATLSDGSRHGVRFALVEHGGPVGLGWGVDACLDGLDHWHVHDGVCRTVRP